MDRTSWLERNWYETSVPVFLERFVLPVLAAALIGVIILNPFKLDWQQQASLSLAVVALAFFIGHTVHRLNNPPKPVVSSEATQETKRATQAEGKGSQNSASSGPGFKEGAKSKIMDHSSKSVDRSVKIGGGSTITNSPIVTGDSNTVNVGSPARNLTESSISGLGNELESFPEQPVHIVAGFFDGEGQHYAEQFHEAFMRAKWNIVQFVFQDKLPKGTELGLWMGVKDKTNQPAAAIVLGKYLVGTLHLQVQGIEFTDAQDGHVYLIVGLKP